MRAVETVAGPVSASELGLTFFHEHLLTWREPVPVQFPHLYALDEAFDAAVEKARAARLQGLRTMCDASVMGIGRDVRFARRVADASGIQIVAATGMYTFADLPPYFLWRSIDTLADVFVHDIEVGIQGTAIKAGFLKCATDLPGVTAGVERVLRAVARAHRRTGVPILTHTNPVNASGLLQQEVFEEEGVDLRRVAIGHCGDTDDLSYLLRIARRGSFLGLDRYGRSDVMSTARRNATVQALFKEGLSAQLLVSHDSVWAPRDFLEEPEVEAQRQNWRPTYLLGEVVPQLRQLGLDQSDLDRLLIENPRAWLTPQAPY